MIKKLAKGVLEIQGKAEVGPFGVEELKRMQKDNPWGMINRMEEIARQNLDCVECRDWRCGHFFQDYLACRFLYFFTYFYLHYIFLCVFACFLHVFVNICLILFIQN